MYKIYPKICGLDTRISKILLIMKLTTLLLIVTIMQVSATVHAQKLTLKQKNVSIARVFEEIERQTGYDVFYQPKVLQTNKTINANFENTPLDEVLKACLGNQPVMYTIDEKTIVIKQKEKSFFDNFIDRFRAIDVRGKILDENGKPMPNANIMVKGKNQIYKSNEKGEFNIPNIAEDAVLVISYIGYKQLEIPLKDAVMPLEIKLNVQTGELEEVNVTVNTGYQSIPKERATGSFAQPTKEIFDNRVSTDVISKIEGITSGVLFSINPLTGNRELSVRGRNTIFAIDQPFIVVDNFPYSGTIDDLNPNDIEDVTILKDAAAASIWGVRAGNGVIVITTKKGKLAQPLKISFNSNLTVGQRPDLKYNPNFLNSNEFIDVERTLFNNGFYDADLTGNNFSLISPVVDILNRRKLGQISVADSEALLSDLSSIDYRDQLSKYFYRPSVNQQYALNFNGGSDRTNYFFSVGYDKNTGNVQNSDYNRITINSNNTFKLVKGVDLSAGLYFARSKSESGNIIGELIGSRGLLPYTKFADESGASLPIIRDYRASFTNNAPSRGFLDWQFRPLDELSLNTTKNENNSIRFFSGLRFDILKGLTADIKYQHQRESGEGNSLRAYESYYVRNFINTRATVNASGIVTKLDNIPLGGIYGLSNRRLESNNLRAQANYNRQWSKHSIDAVAGVEAWEVRTEGNASTLYGYDPNTTNSRIPTITGSTLYPSGQFASVPNNLGITTSLLDRFRSYFGNASYSYLNRYTASISGRVDASNIFGVRSNQKFLPLWSSGIKWDIHKEPFFSLKWLPVLEFRATYGFNGNVDKSVTAYTTAVYANNALVSGYPLATIQGAPNPDLRWEKNRIINFGVNFETTNRVVSGSIEYFVKKGVDLLGDAILAPSSGYVNPSSLAYSVRGNFSDMRGQGIDIALETKNIDRVFRWTSKLIFSRATDEVTRFGTRYNPAFLVTNLSASGGGIYPVVGYPVFSLYSFKWGGLDATGQPQGYINNQISKDYPTLNSPASLEDIVYSGPARPTTFGGLSNTVSWKNWSAFLTINYKLGYYFRRPSISYSGLVNTWGGNRDFSKRWQQPGDEATTNVPVFTYPVNPARDNFYSFSEALVEKGDHIRLQDFNLAYTFSNKQLGISGLSSVQLYLYANNIGILWRANKANLDPDVLSTAYPNPRSVAFGARVNF